MKISEALVWLKKLQSQVGDVPIYFDCPTCKQSFTPTRAVTMAAHLAPDEKEKK